VGPLFEKASLCYNASMGKFGFKDRNLGGFFPGRIPKDLFWIAVAKAAA
jgi:hypothetical protein